MKLETVALASTALWRIALAWAALTFKARTVCLGFFTGGLPILTLRFFIFIPSVYLTFTLCQALFFFFLSESCHVLKMAAGGQPAETQAMMSADTKRALPSPRLPLPPGMRIDGRLPALFGSALSAE